MNTIFPVAKDKPEASFWGFEGLSAASSRNFFLILLTFHDNTTLHQLNSPFNCLMVFSMRSIY